MEESIALAELEASWRRENEKFQKFQRLANRNLQLAKAFMNDQQKTDFEVKRKINQDREKQVFPQISPIPSNFKLIPNGHFLDLKNKLSNLESRVEQLVSKRNKFEAAKIENEELKREQAILKNQIQTITAKKFEAKQSASSLALNSPKIKTDSFEHLNCLHQIKRKHLEEEIVGCHITFESIRLLVEKSLSLLNADHGTSSGTSSSAKLETEIENLRRANIKLRSTREKSPKNLDSYDEHVQRIEQLHFVNDLREHDHENAINLLEKKYAMELEKSFEINEKIKAQIESCDSIDLRELSTAYANETELYFQREKELEMLKKAFLQQEEDFKIHISKLKRLKH